MTDGFEQEPTGADGVAENYTAFKNWKVVGGGVDVADPSNRFVKVPSKIVDLEGSNQSKPGAIETKQRFDPAPAGCVAIVDVTAGGNGRNGASDTFEVRYGGNVVRKVTLAGSDPFAVQSFKLPSVASTVTIAQTNPAGDQAGVMVDKVVIRHAAA